MRRTARLPATAARALTMTPARESILDLRGLNCPQPVLRAKKALRNVPIGGILVLECTDPLTVIDVPLFARQTGHDLVSQSDAEGLYIYKIVRRH
jgi:tRNA 2-thiouridine synthesizing protein A